MKNRNYTKTGFIWLLIPLVYIAVIVVFALLATWAESISRDSVIYIVLVVIDLVLFLLFPAFQTGCSIVSIVNQIKALRADGSKRKIIVMMVVSILYIGAAILFACRAWEGFMSA